MRNRSGMFVAPERRISSWVMTKMAAAVFESFCSFFETEVTSTFIGLRCSRSLGLRRRLLRLPQDSTQTRIPRRKAAVPRNPMVSSLKGVFAQTTPVGTRAPLISKTLLVSELADPRQCQKGPLVPNRSTCFISSGGSRFPITDFGRNSHSPPSAQTPKGSRFEKARSLNSAPVLYLGDASLRIRGAWPAQVYSSAAATFVLNFALDRFASQFERTPVP